MLLILDCPYTTTPRSSVSYSNSQDMLTTVGPRYTRGIRRVIHSYSITDAPVLGCSMPLCPTGFPRLPQCTFPQLYPGCRSASFHCPAAAAHRTSFVLVFKPTQADSKKKLIRPAGKTSLERMPKNARLRQQKPTRYIGSSEPFALYQVAP